MNVGTRGAGSPGRIPDAGQPRYANGMNEIRTNLDRGVDDTSAFSVVRGKARAKNLS